MLVGLLLAYTVAGDRFVFLDRYGTQVDETVFNDRRTALISKIARGWEKAFAFTLYVVWIHIVSLICRIGDCEFTYLTKLRKLVTGLVFGGMMLLQTTISLTDVKFVQYYATKPNLNVFCGIYSKCRGVSIVPFISINYYGRGGGGIMAPPLPVVAPERSAGNKWNVSKPFPYVCSAEQPVLLTVKETSGTQVN